jgi:trehalose 6-phosphate synthase/phosphatase
MFLMGIDVHQLRVNMQEPQVEDWVQVLKQRYAGMKLDETQGVKQKLFAFEAFLLKYPSFQGKVVLIQVAL